MACSALYTAIVQHLAATPPPGYSNVAGLTLTAQSPGDPSALVQTVSGYLSKDAAGDLISNELSGVSNQGATTANQVTNLTRLWIVTLKSDGTLHVQEGTGRLIVLDLRFVSTDGNCGLAPNFFVGTFTVPVGLHLPGQPVPPSQTGVVVMSISLTTSVIIP